MGFFARDWIDRLLGRRAAEERTGTAADDTDPASMRLADVEEGAAAARDDTVSDRDATPMPPPGTG